MADSFFTTNGSKDTEYIYEAVSKEREVEDCYDNPYDDEDDYDDDFNNFDD